MIGRDKDDRNVYMYQIQSVQVIFQDKALHSPLEICKYSQSLLRGEGGRKGGSTKLSRTVPLLWICKNRQENMQMLL